jgi:ADP-dependent NAD(P)H-hydrate dehydratase / NAD(P)H-hydrate epimerase
MKIFPVNAISEIDEFTIENEPILSVNLMERASRKIFDSIRVRYAGRPFVVFAGPGNNGGDALALSRMLLIDGFQVVTVMLKSEGLSNDTRLNRERLGHFRQAEIVELEKGGVFPELSPEWVVIDGLFGSGLNRPLEGAALEIVKKINASNLEVISIDIPSGLMGEDNAINNREGIVKASYTYTFQFPKLAFLFPENHLFVGEWEVLPIGLHPDKIESLHTNWVFTEHQDVTGILPKRHRFVHKGEMGHVYLIAGSYGKMGAAVLASRACLKSGVGLLTVQVPHATCQILHAAVPEAMVNIDRSDLMFTEFPLLSQFSAVAAGPGIGTRSNACKALDDLLVNIGNVPLVLDADALNILAANPDLLAKLPENAVLTPHPREFERLVGKWDNDYQRLQLAVQFSQKHKVVLVLKGAFTTVVMPSGMCHFNSTGNPGMATAGAGDTLTGIILALLGRGISPEKAALLGVYVHGLAGDLACDNEGEEGMTASDIIAVLGRAFRLITQ